MNNTEHKNQLPNFSEEKDIYYQEIEKTTFLVESELKDFKELIYLCSNKKRTYFKKIKIKKIIIFSFS